MNIEKEELVVLKEFYDDSNYKRVYQVTDVDVRSNRVFVKVISEKSTDPEKYPEKSDKSLVGKELGPFEAHLFNPYL